MITTVRHPDLLRDLQSIEAEANSRRVSRLMVALLVASAAALLFQHPITVAIALVLLVLTHRARSDAQQAAERAKAHRRSAARDVADRRELVAMSQSKMAAAASTPNANKNNNDGSYYANNTANSHSGFPITPNNNNMMSNSAGGASSGTGGSARRTLDLPTPGSNTRYSGGGAGGSYSGRRSTGAAYTPQGNGNSNGKNTAQHHSAAYGMSMGVGLSPRPHTLRLSGGSPHMMVPPSSSVVVAAETPEELRRRAQEDYAESECVRRLATMGTSPFASTPSQGCFRVQREELEVAAAADRGSGGMHGGGNLVGLEAATVRLKHWVSTAVLRRVVADLDKSNRWFARQSKSEFNATQPLSEVLPNGMLKVAFLEDTKRRNGTDLDMVQHIEARLALEAVLSVESTFPFGAPLSQPDLAQRRQYILQRIYTLAQESTLAGFNPDGGDPYSWREAMHPTDAQLLAHLMGATHPPLARHMRLPHQPLNDSRRDIAMYMGSNGGSVFYVRHLPHPGAREELLRPPHPGHRDSLFHALIMLFTTIQERYGGTSGGLGSVLDLSREGLDTVVGAQATSYEE